MRADHGPRPHDPAHVRREEHAVVRAADPPGTRSRARSRRGSRPARGARPSACRSCRTCRRAGTAPRSRPSTGSSSPGCSATASSHQTSRPVVIGQSTPARRQTTTCSTRRRVRERLVEHLLHRDELAAAVRRVRREHDLRAARRPAATTPPARRSPRRSAPGPRRCARTRARRSPPRGAIGRNVPTASPSPTPSSTERLGEPAHLVRELRPRQRACARRPRAPTPPPRRPASRAPSGGRTRPRRSAARRRTRSSTRSRASRRARRPSPARAGSRDRRRRRARTGRAPRSRHGGAPRSRRSRASVQAGDVRGCELLGRMRRPGELSRSCLVSDGS